MRLGQILWGCKCKVICRTNQQHSDGHESSSAGGHGAVHQDDVVLADVLGQAEVVELQGWEENPTLLQNTCPSSSSRVGCNVQKRATHLRLPCAVVGLDEDLPQSDVLAHGHQRLLHGFPGPQDRHTCNLPRPAG